MGKASRTKKERAVAGVKFERAAKVGTPVGERTENQPHDHYMPNMQVSRGVTAAAKRRMSAYGLSVSNESTTYENGSA